LQQIPHDERSGRRAGQEKTTMTTCPHVPACPSSDAPDAAAAKIVAEHLQECGYALLCNGRVLLEHDGLLPVPAQRDLPVPVAHR
jgi:hypothetical protein